MTTFEVIPAIDVLGGRVVRLMRGDFDKVTVYEDDPFTVAAGYATDGARRLHVVDLDGARRGRLDVGFVEQLAELDLELQLGGGIRTVDSARELLDRGVARVVVGSMAIATPALLDELVATVGGSRVVVAIDIRAGAALGSGWLDDGRRYAAVVGDAVDAGAGSLLVTGIDRDGLMEGLDLGLLARVLQMAGRVEVIASGGIGSVDDLMAAAATGADGAVVGRALLERAFTYREAVAAVS